MTNMENYRVFLYTARLKNVTKAAEALHMTQPSASYAIKQLEETLGVKLFDRLSKGVRLTNEGKTLQGYIEQSFSLVERGEQELQAIKTGKAGELRIGASGPVIKQTLLPYLNLFRPRYPGIKIRLLQRKSIDVANDLKGELIDIGFVHLPLRDRDIETKPLFASQDIFVVGENYRSFAERKIAAEELAKLPLLLPTLESSSRRFIQQWFAGQGISADADIELTSIEMLVEFAILGYGAAFVPGSSAKKELAEGKLFEIPLTSTVPPREIGIAWRKETSLSTAAQAFFDIIIANR